MKLQTILSLLLGVLLRRFLLIFGLILTMDCSSFSKNSLPDLSLIVREEHRNILLLLTKDNYRSGELEKTFQLLSQKGDELCHMFYKNIPVRKELAQSFIGDYQFAKKKNEEWYDNVLHSVVMGCFNFFQMNDMQVQDTMERVSRKYPGEKECYSVGFMQPYFMHNTMNCSRLTMLDADWRILFAHYRLLQGFFQNIDPKTRHLSPDELVSDLPIKWVSRFSGKPSEYEKKIL
ncbi:MAG: hypothetical protein JJT78_12895 [Leptospira sp.]|nr:hypothetical protein [Leptospira sp.]